MAISVHVIKTPKRLVINGCELLSDDIEPEPPFDPVQLKCHVIQCCDLHKKVWIDYKEVFVVTIEPVQKDLVSGSKVQSKRSLKADVFHVRFAFSFVVAVEAVAINQVYRIRLEVGQLKTFLARV